MSIDGIGGGSGTGFQLFKKSTDGQNAIFADASARDVYFGANPSDLTTLDNNEFLIIKLLDNGAGEVAYQQRQLSAWVDVTSLVQGEPGEDSVDVSALNEGDTVRFNSTTAKLEPAPANVDDTTGEFTFDNSINVPSGSVNVGEVLQLSEGIADLVIVDKLKSQMSFSVNSEFTDATGSSDPFYYNFGSPFALNIQTDDTQVLTANPLTFSLTGTVVAPEVRLIDQMNIRTNGPMTNFRAKLVDNVTGLAIRYIPSKTAYDGNADGLTLGTGDVTFYFASEGTTTATDIYLGYSPFLIEASQQIDFTVIADSIDVLGEIGGIPYLTAEAHDGPPIVLGQDAHSKQVQATGILEGGVVSQASGTTVDWTSGRGQVADYTNPEVPVITDVPWDAVAGFTPTNIAIDGQTALGYNSSGVLVEVLATAITIDDPHDIVFFGTVVHVSSTITGVIAAPGNLGYDGITSFADFINLVIGPANVDGNIYGPNGANMTIDVIGGNAYILGSNFRTDTTTPDIVTLASDTALTFIKMYRSAGAGLSMLYDGAPTTLIDPTQYDDGSGTLQAVGANNWTIQRIFRSRGSATIIAYGQEVFNTKALALEALGSESFIEKSPLPLTLFRGSLVVSEAATDLSDTSDAEFFAQSSFRTAGAQSASSTIPGVTIPGGADTSIQFNNAGAFGGDSNFTYDSTNKTVELKSPAAGNATYEFVDSTDDLKATIKYDESADEFRIDVLNGLSELHLNDRVVIERGAADGRIDVLPTTNVGKSLLTLSNFGGGTGLEIRFDDSIDSSTISSEFGSLTIQTTSGTEDIIMNATGDIAFGIQSYPETLALEEGTYGNANSTNIILNKGDGGTNQSEFVMFNDSNVTESARYFRMSYTDEIATQGGINISDANNYVSIGTRTDPDSPLHIYENTTETGDQAGLTIEQDGTGDAITQYLLTGGQRWVTGIDNSGSDAFKIASSINLGSNDQLVLETDGRSEFLGQLGINILPVSIMHVYEDTSNTDATAGLTIEQDGLGDALVQFLLTGGQRWIAGIDNSSSGDDFSISGRGALSGATNNFSLDNTQGLILKNDSSATGVFDTLSGIRLDNIDSTDGNFTSVVNYGAANISSGIAFINDDHSANIGHIEFGIRGAGGFTHALTLQEGNYGNVNSTNLIFNKGDEGTNQSEFVMFNDSHATEITRYFRMSYADEIATQGGINISDANNYVSIGTRTDPDSVLHIYENTTETGDQAGLTIEQDGTGDAITQYLLSGGQRWVTGIDNSGSDAFKIASSINLGSNDQLVLETDGRSEFLGQLGVNILPASTMHVYEDTAEVDAAAGLTIEQDGVGDAVAQFLLTGSQRWVMGIDNSDDDNFVFAKSADLNSNQQLVLQVDGKNNFYGTLGVGKIPDDGYRLDVLTSISTVVGLSSFKAVTIEAGKNGSGNSTDFFFNRGNVGFNQSEFTMFNDNNASGPSRMFRMGYTDDIATSGGLTVWKTRNNVAVGTYSLPDSVFTVSENTTETGDQAGLTIIQEGTGDAIAQFLLDGGQRWVMGIDNSANDAFKIASSINLGSNDRFVLDPTDGAFIFSNTETGNVLTLGNSTGEISKITINDAGSPEGAVFGTGGDLHINADSVRSTASLKKSTGSSTDDWYDFDLVPPNLKVIYNTTELEAMASFSVITISASTTWIIKGHLSSDVRIEFTNNATLHIVTDNSNQSTWTYSGTGTMFSGAGRLRSLEFFDLVSSSTGTFCNLELNGGSVNLTLAGVFGWDDLGTINNGTLILDVSDIFDNLLGWDLFNCKITLTKSNITNTPTTALPFLNVDNSTAAVSKSISVDQMSGTFASGASLFRIQPALSDLPKNLISACIFGGGNLFDISGSTGEFTVVADASVPAEAITSVTDSSGVARFNFTAPPTLFVFQEVVISGFTTNTDYNGTYLITATGANYFEVSSIDFGSDETGSFLSNSITVTDTGTTLIDGDQVTISTSGSTDYDGGAIIYNQLTNTFQINRTFISTHTGEWSQAGLDQTDPRVLAQANPGFADSNYLCFGHIEENPVTNATTISVADTYQAIDISGTLGSVTVFATNGAGGTTCTSTSHGLAENQNVVLTLGDEYYRGEFTIFNVTVSTFDIARTFQSTVLTSTWTAGYNSENERFKTIDASIGLVEYIGNEPFEGAVKITWSVYKSGSSENYLFSSGKNGVSPEQGSAYQKRTVTTATSVHPVTVPVSLIKGDTIQPILASVTTTNSITVENLEMEIS